MLSNYTVSPDLPSLSDKSNEMLKNANGKVVVVVIDDELNMLQTASALIGNVVGDNNVVAITRHKHMLVDRVNCLSVDDSEWVWHLVHFLGQCRARGQKVLIVLDYLLHRYPGVDISGLELISTVAKETQTEKFGEDFQAVLWTVGDLSEIPTGELETANNLGVRIPDSTPGRKDTAIPVDIATGMLVESEPASAEA